MSGTSSWAANGHLRLQNERPVVAEVADGEVLRQPFHSLGGRLLSSEAVVYSSVDPLRRWLIAPRVAFAPSKWQKAKNALEAFLLEDTWDK